MIHQNAGRPTANAPLIAAWRSRVPFGRGETGHFLPFPPAASLHSWRINCGDKYRRPALPALLPFSARTAAPLRPPPLSPGSSPRPGEGVPGPRAGAVGRTRRVFRSLPRRARRGGVLKCTLVRAGLNTEPASAPVLRPGGEGRLCAGVSERGYVEFDFPLPALRRTERYYLQWVPKLNTIV